MVERGLLGRGAGVWPCLVDSERARCCLNAFPDPLCMQRAGRARVETPVGTVVAVRTKFDTFEGAVYCVDAKSPDDCSRDEPSR